MLSLECGNSTDTGPDNDTAAGLVDSLEVQARIVQRLRRRIHGILLGQIHAAALFLRDRVAGIEVLDLSGNSGGVVADVEASHGADSAPAFEQTPPGLINAVPDGRKRPQTRDDCAMTHMLLDKCMGIAWLVSGTTQAVSSACCLI